MTMAHGSRGTPENSGIPVAVQLNFNQPRITMLREEEPQNRFEFVTHAEHKIKRSRGNRDT